jgi:hypothetical protein
VLLLLRPVLSTMGAQATSRLLELALTHDTSIHKLAAIRGSTLEL